MNPSTFMNKPPDSSRTTFDWGKIFVYVEISGDYPDLSTNEATD
jgi:hypothetical protein